MLFRRRKPLKSAVEWMEEIVDREPGAKIEHAMVIAEVRIPGRAGTAVVFAGDEREATKTTTTEGLIRAADRAMSSVVLSNALRSAAMFVPED